MAQEGIGIHTRQYARAFIIQDGSGNRAVFVNADISAFSHAMKRDVYIFILFEVELFS